MQVRALYIFAVLGMTAVLAACGGGGDNASSPGSDAPTRMDVPFASPAMFVATGQSSKSLSFTACQRKSDATPVSSATLVINATGDLVFSGATGTASVAEIGRMNFADMQSKYVSTYSGPSTSFQ